MYKLLKITHESSEKKNNVDYFTNLMCRGICLEEIVDGIMLEIAIWFVKDHFENYRLNIGNHSKKGVIYNMALYDILGIQIGGTHSQYSTIINDQIIGIITKIRIIWLYFPTPKSARVFRNFFDRLMISNRKTLRLQDYL